ncbi:helix-turn-helix transcriptional regulator [Orbaceae bacterium ESL0727]|nr:helix-turn-helix transcriptional regulator [Orbaceae bacterium ESL0727]
MNITTNKYHKTFCKRLKQARLNKKLSQKQLGILAGIDEFVASARINRYEKGIHEADLGTAGRLAEVLDAPLAYFYATEDELALLIQQWYENKKMGIIDFGLIKKQD